MTRKWAAVKADLAGIRNRAAIAPQDHDKPKDDDSVTTFLARRREALKAQGAPVGGRKWYTIQARAATPTEVDVLITGEIGWDVDSGMFARALAAPDIANATVLHVSLNSVGGDVFDGIGIYNSLVGHGAQVIVTVTGIAASIASVIAMAGDIVIMGRGAQMMIHDAHAVQIGNADDMRKMADILDRASDNIATFYAERAGGTAEQWRAVMQEERWYLAQEAVDAGLADEVTAAPERQTTSAADTAITLAAKVRHVPRQLAARATNSTDDGVEQQADTSFADLLRDIGRELTAEFAPPPDPLAGVDLGAEIRSAVAFVATDVDQPNSPSVDTTPPEMKFQGLADLRRSIQEGM